MKTIHPIILLTDFSKNSTAAVKHAVHYAIESQKSITIINVVEYPSRILEPILLQISANIFNHEEVLEATQKLLTKTAREISLQHHIEVNTKILFSNNADAFFQSMADSGVEIIISGIGNETSISTLFSCKNINQMAGNSKIPMITVNNHSDYKKIENILFPINNFYYTTQKVDDIIKISRIYGASVTLLGIAPNEEEKINAMSFYMESLLEKLEKNNVKTKIKMTISNNYSEAILKFSEQKGVDMISVVASYEDGLKNLFKSNHDVNVICDSKVPVLTLRPVAKNSIQVKRQKDQIPSRTMKFDVHKVMIPLKN
jgi:nucleotide-binding universal stress UspA family protein